MKNKNDNLIEAESGLEANITKFLYIQGNKIASKEGYKHHTGIDAVRFFLVERHHWTPSQVKGMSNQDLAFALEDIEGI